MIITPPVGVAQLHSDIAGLRIPRGRPVLVHCSMRRIGPVAGGPAGLLTVLRSVTGPASTIVVPTHTANNSTTSPAFRRAVHGLDERATAAYIDHMPGFDRAATPSYEMGAFAEYIRRHPGSVRSAHPQTSFAALGPAAEQLMAVHDLDSHLGERSPLARLYDADAFVLLAGVGYEVCTAFHLAEYRVGGVAREHRCFTSENGRRRQRRFSALHLDDHDFVDLGAAFEGECLVAAGHVGNGSARALALRHAVDFAGKWLPAHRRR